MQRFSGVLRIGLGSSVMVNKIVSILDVGSKPIRTLISEAKQDKRIRDCTRGRAIKSVILTDDNFMYLSFLSAETLVNRLTDSQLIEESKYTDNNPSD
jgi:regulator of extracellular matrix RemA (YlzA/DUF370 family)